jgi:hypothetical protein
MSDQLPPGFRFLDEEPAPVASAPSLPPGFRFADEPAPGPQPANVPLPPRRPDDINALPDNPQPAVAPMPTPRPPEFGSINDDAGVGAPTTNQPAGGYAGDALSELLGAKTRLTPEEGHAEKDAKVAAARQQFLDAQKSAAAAKANAPAVDAAQSTQLPTFGEYVAPPSGTDIADNAANQASDSASRLVDAQTTQAPQLTPGWQIAEQGINAAGHAVTGAAGIVGKAQRDFLGQPAMQQGLDKANSAIDRAFTPDPGRADELGTKVAGAVGGMAPLLPLAAWSPAAAAIFSGMGGANTAYEKTEGAQAEGKQGIFGGNPLVDRWLAAIGGGAIGTAQMAPFSRLLGRMEEMAPGSVIGAVGQAAKSGAQTSVEQVLVQSLSTLGENGIHKLLADKDQALLDGVKESAEIAGIVGGALGIGGAAWASATNRAALAERIARSTPAEIDAFLGKHAGMQTRTEIDDFIKNKEAADAAKEAQSAPALAAPVENPAGKSASVVSDNRATAQPTAPTNPAESHTDKNTPATEGVLSIQPGDATLRAMGYGDEEIALMGPRQRAAELAQAAQEGISVPDEPTGAAGERAGTATPAVSEANTDTAESGTRAAPVKADEPALPPGFKFLDEPGEIPPAIAAPTAAKGTNGDAFQARNEGDASRPVENAGVPSLVVNEGQVRSAEEQGLPSVRGARDNDLSSVAKPLPNLSKGHGTKTDAETLPGPAGQQQGLLAGKLPVGDNLRAEQQPTEQSASNISGQNSNDRPLGERAGDVTASAPRPAQALANGKGSGKPTNPKAPQTLVAFLRAAGGLKDSGGELRARDMHRRHPGLVNNKKGMPLDRAREAAVEAGYIDTDNERHGIGEATSTIDDLLDAIDKHPTYSSFDEKELAEWQAHKGGKEQRDKELTQAENDIHADLVDSGNPPHLIEDHYVREGARLHVDEGVPIVDAYEQAVMRDAREFAGDQAKELDPDIPWDDYETAPETAPAAEHQAGEENPASEEPRAAEGAEAGSAVRRDGEEGSDRGAEEESAPDRNRPSPGGSEERSEIGADGKPQLILAGTENIGDGELAQRKSDEGLKPKAPQKDADGLALFNDSSKQTDLLDQPKQEEKPAPIVEAPPAGQKTLSPFDPSKGVPDAVADYLYRGEAFADIRAARKFVAEHGGKDLNQKQIEEAIEHGVVKAARAIVAESKTPAETYDRLVALYANQPKLGTRTSTSVEQQAYSTPAPLAYIASELAGIGPRPASMSRPPATACS